MILTLQDITDVMTLLDGNQENFTPCDAMRAIGIENADEIGDALLVKLGAASGILMSGIAIGVALAGKQDT